MQFKPRNYKYKGIDTGDEQKRFWIFLVIGLLIGAAIIYLF